MPTERKMLYRKVCASHVLVVTPPGAKPIIIESDRGTAHLGLVDLPPGYTVEYFKAADYFAQGEQPEKTLTARSTKP